MYKCKYFKIYELVSEGVYTRYGDATCWQFLDERLLMSLDTLREALGRPITVNNWYWGGHLSQRGYRGNLDPMILSYADDREWYNSQHAMGRAVDLNVKGMTAQEVRDFIMANQDLFPYITYLEDGTSWVHFDVRQSAHKGIYLFKG